MTISQRELNRQYRVLKQILSMHTFLKDKYERFALIIDIILLICAVVFCATTFIRDDVFTHIGLASQNVRFILGITSIVAFLTSLITLRVGWKGKAALHKEAERKLTTVLEFFRELYNEDKTWPQEKSIKLHNAYWEAMKNTIDVPANKFVGLKARHLRKVKLSTMLDDAPGSSIWLLRLINLFRSSKKALKMSNPDKKTDDKE